MVRSNLIVGAGCITRDTVVPVPDSLPRLERNSPLPAEARPLFRPESTRPVRPTTSPQRTTSETLHTLLPQLRFFTIKHGWPSATVLLGNSWSRRRPTISSMGRLRQTSPIGHLPAVAEHQHAIGDGGPYGDILRHGLPGMFLFPLFSGNRRLSTDWLFFQAAPS